MFKVRDNEPDYAFIPDVKAEKCSQHGTPIQLVDEKSSELAGKSLNINGDVGIGENPNRYKQHGFHFTADNCIACHACEAACSEKNDLPAHISFRSVGYVEGGSYPAYRRVNISMACNHCEDPVCLKGCPTRAYTKFAEYGAVLQDPDICFGCGYCTWVCPYNAPQLDLVKGQVSKCNMCVDRLEVGLKPACASACLGGALDFGIIETTPENRDQAKLDIPGFPTPEITHPNIRFQQTRSLPNEMGRADTMPLRYVRDDKGTGHYRPTVGSTTSDGGAAEKRQWNLKKLSSRENPLVFFTLISQAVIGAFLMLFLGPLFGFETLSYAQHPVVYTALLFALLAVEGGALGMSTLHLGKPHRFYRAFNNLRYSPVSREVASLGLFYSLLGAYALATLGLFNWLPDLIVATLMTVTGWLAALVGPLALYAMHKIYRIKARPFWDHWQVLTSFYGNMLTLGALTIALVYAPVLIAQGESIHPLMSVLIWPVLLGLLMECAGLFAHARYLVCRGDEAAASHLLQRTQFGNTYRARNVGLALGLLGSVVCVSAGVDGGVGLLAWLLVATLIVTTALVGRALFYVLVIPTTMPGAFFWRNAGFQEHARESGLAETTQAGVLPHEHYQKEALDRAAKELKEDFATIKAQGVAVSLRRLKESVVAVAKTCFA